MANEIDNVTSIEVDALKDVDAPEKNVDAPKEDVLTDNVCGLCLDDTKEACDLDVACSTCKFHVCYECMFEYIRHNKSKDSLLCPHCRQDLLDDLDLYSKESENLLSIYLVQTEIEKMEKMTARQIRRMRNLTDEQQLALIGHILNLRENSYDKYDTDSDDDEQDEYEDDEDDEDYEDSDDTTTSSTSSTE